MKTAVMTDSNSGITRKKERKLEYILFQCRLSEEMFFTKERTLHRKNIMAQ